MPKRRQNKKIPVNKQSLQEQVFAPARTAKGNANNVKRMPKAKEDNVFLSSCALRYALAIADPFSPGAKQACIPRAPSLASLKNTSVTRVTAVIGTNGFGFVLLTPTIANDSAAIWYTTSTFTGTGFTPLSTSNVLSTGVVTSNLPTPYGVASLINTQGGSSVAGRIVSCGARVKYTGTTMNESGAYYCYVSPTHDNVLALGSSTASIGAFLETVVETVDRQPCSISAYGINDNETSYSNSQNATNQSILYPFSPFNTGFNSGLTYNPGYQIGSPVGLIGFTGVAGSTFLVEIIQHTEYTGPSAATLATPTDADTMGYDRVQAAAALLPLKKQEDRNMHKSPINLMFEAIKQVSIALKPIAINAMVKYGAAMLA